ncbi:MULTISPECIES: response regulator transcription factor [Actinokineospora]|uniref:DNA-binding response regulator, OmpR family, contains REC and winged-helix (WHTH) domain n=1 Tax=Actinokineospora diospyrosa TaxID=103728 RepID=A0ABT1I971_9PSEU|nr:MULTISPECIES: response regulator transcription factor [Actinokineospora]MBM7773361.1 DNA-binding response OmpR family regulator [Actinokineospora baliensis]MCP2269106.1 DNA-binding response regulator, OmpR family, contains REC and winged-helix (wHTH) domain [Actinokineospora diospyrosa]
MSNVLVVEDEPDIALALRVILERAGHEVTVAPDGRQGLRALHESHPTLVLLDIGLPVIDGWMVLERIRDVSDVPVLLLTAHGMEADKVRGLRGGADDYLTKPFSTSELLARIEAILRRTEQAGGTSQAEVYDDGVVRMDHRSRRVFVNGVEAEVNATEYRLLATFVQHRGAVLSPRQLLNLVWNDPTGIGADRVKFAVLRLRRKLNWSADDSPIKAARGMGYRYDVPKS